MPESQAPPPHSSLVPRLFTLGEIAKLEGCHVETIRRRIARGELGHVKLNRRVYVRDDQYAAYIDAHTIDADEEDESPPGRPLSPAPAVAS